MRLGNQQVTVVAATYCWGEHHSMHSRAPCGLEWVQSCQEWLAWPLGKLCQIKQKGQNETSPTPVPTQHV